MDLQQMFVGLQNSINDVMSKKKILEDAQNERAEKLKELDAKVDKVQEDYTNALVSARKVKSDWDAVMSPILPPEHLEGRVR